VSVSFAPVLVHNRLQCGTMQGDAPVQRISISSFSYAHTLPRDVDAVVDVRCMPNPVLEHPDMIQLTGKDQAVAAVLASWDSFDPFFNALKQRLVCLLTEKRDGGGDSAAFAFGCVGGRHRSVFVAEQIGEWLRATWDLEPRVWHRDSASLNGFDIEIPSRGAPYCEDTRQPVTELCFTDFGDFCVRVRPDVQCPISMNTVLKRRRALIEKRKRERLCSLESTPRDSVEGPAECLSTPATLVDY